MLASFQEIANDFIHKSFGIEVRKRIDNISDYAIHKGSSYHLGKSVDIFVVFIEIDFLDSKLYVSSGAELSVFDTIEDLCKAVKNTTKQFRKLSKHFDSPAEQPADLLWPFLNKQSPRFKRKDVSKELFSFLSNVESDKHSLFIDSSSSRNNKALINNIMANSSSVLAALQKINNITYEEELA